jgi:VWFA-related protein
MHQTTTLWRLALPVIGLLAAAPLVGARGAEPAPQRRFVAGVELVAVDFVAVDEAGRPVKDLKLDEVSLKIDGRSRPIRSLQYVDVARPPAAGAPTEPLPPPYGSNSVGAAGRAFIIVIDDESFRPGKETPMREAVGEFIGGLATHDRIALVTVPHGGTKVDLTTEHARVTEFLKTLVGQAPQQLDASAEACRTRRTLESLDGLLRGLQNPEGPTTVMFFSSSLLSPRRDAMLTRAPGVCEITREHYLYVGQSAGLARAQFFVVMPTEVMPDPAYELANFSAATGSANPMEGLEHLAGITGGHRLTLATTQDRPLDRVLAETSGYYLVGFEPEPSDRGGDSHGLSIDIARSGVTRRVRPYISIGEAKPDDPVPTITPADMLREGRIYRDLQLRATAYVSRGDAAGELLVAALGEIVDPAGALTAAAAGLFDTNGRLVAQWTAKPEELGRRAALGALAAAPGTYRLRFAARDADGRTGTADTEVQVGLPGAAGFELSSIVLGLSRPIAGRAGAAFQPRLEFTTEPVAIAYVEVYGGQAGDRVRAQVEIAQSVDGPAVVALPLALEPTNVPNKFQATGAVPIGSLPAGDYIVRVVVGPEGAAEARVMRTLRKVG